MNAVSTAEVRGMDYQAIVSLNALPPTKVTTLMFYYYLQNEHVTSND